MTRWKRGSAAAIPGVSTQPGCIAWKATPVPARRRAHSRLSATWARLARAYAVAPRYPRAVTCHAAGSSRCVYMPADETVMTRDRPAARSTGRSRLVSRNGAITCPAAVSSVPAALTR